MKGGGGGTGREGNKKQEAPWVLPFLLSSPYPLVISQVTVHTKSCLFKNSLSWHRGEGILKPKVSMLYHETMGPLEARQACILRPFPRLPANSHLPFIFSKKHSGSQLDRICRRPSRLWRNRCYCSLVKQSGSCRRV